MNDITHEALKRRVAAARDSVLHAKIGENHRTVLLDLLDKGESVSNGHPDKIQGMTEVLVLFILRNVLNDLSMPSIIGAEVTSQLDTHIKSCPLTKLQESGSSISIRSKTGVKEELRSNNMKYVVDRLVQCQWSLCVAAVLIFGFAPNADMIITKLITLAK